MAAAVAAVTSRTVAIGGEPNDGEVPSAHVGGGYAEQEFLHCGQRR
jgi:hypothetical protein